VEGAEGAGGEWGERGGGESAGDGFGDVECCEVGCRGEDAEEGVDENAGVVEVEGTEA